MIKFIVDTHLPPGLALWLTKHGYESTHPCFLPSGENMTDQEIREFASLNNYIVLTKDKDFFDYYIVKGTPPRVFLLQFGNIRNKDLFIQFSLHIDSIINEFELDAQLILFNYNQISKY